MRVIRAVFGILLVCAWPRVACAFEAPAPQRTPPPDAPPAPVSMIGAHLSIPAAEILRVLNARTRNDIADLHGARIGCAIASCVLDLTATRTGPITGSLSGGALSLAVPIAATAHLALRSPLFKAGAQGSAEGVARATTALALGRDWRLAPRTRGTVLLNKGEIRLGPMKIDIAQLWNGNSAQLSAPLFAMLDRNIATSAKLRTQAQRLWDALFRPIPIGKAPRAWLLLAPDRILVKGPDMRDDRLDLSLALALRAQIVVSEQVPAAMVSPPLPPPAAMAVPSDRFAVAVPVLLPYADAAKLAMRRLSGKPLRIGGAVVRVQSLVILPSGEDVVVAARFCLRQGWDPFGWFDSCGAGYLRGRPSFDAQSGTIRVANLHVDLATENLFLSLLRALAGDGFARALQPALAFPVGAELAKLETEVTSALARPEGRTVRLSGVVDSFGAPALLWTRDGFLVSFSARGRATAELQTGTD